MKISCPKSTGSFLLLAAGLLNMPAFAQRDPSGEWAPRFHEDQPERIPGPEIGDYLGIPINPSARLRADSWDASLLELPENQCRPHPSDYAWRGPCEPARLEGHRHRQSGDDCLPHPYFLAGAGANHLDGWPRPSSGLCRPYL